MAYKDPEKQKANHKAWREANREKLRANTKKYRDTNPEKVRAKQHVYREANREKLTATSTAWRKANPEKVKAWREAYIKNPINAALVSIYKITGLKKAEIPTELLEAQALIISIHREIRNHEKLHRA